MHDSCQVTVVYQGFRFRWQMAMRQGLHTYPCLSGQPRASKRCISPPALMTHATSSRLRVILHRVDSSVLAGIAGIHINEDNVLQVTERKHSRQNLRNHRR